MVLFVCLFRSARMGSRAPHRDCLSSALWIRRLTLRLLRCATLRPRTSSRRTSLPRIRRRRSPTRRLRTRDTRTWPTRTSPSAPCISTSRPPGTPRGAATRRTRESYRSHTARWASSRVVNTLVFPGSCTRLVRERARWETRRSVCTRLNTAPRSCRQVFTQHVSFITAEWASYRRLKNTNPVGNQQDFDYFCKIFFHSL